MMEDVKTKPLRFILRLWVPVPEALLNVDGVVDLCAHLLRYPTLTA